MERSQYQHVHDRGQVDSSMRLEAGTSSLKRIAVFSHNNFFIRRQSTNVCTWCILILQINSWIVWAIESSKRVDGIHPRAKTCVHNDSQSASIIFPAAPLELLSTQVATILMASLAITLWTFLSFVNFCVNFEIRNLSRLRLWISFWGFDAICRLRYHFLHSSRIVSQRFTGNVRFRKKAAVGGKFCPQTSASSSTATLSHRQLGEDPSNLLHQLFKTKRRQKSKFSQS